MKPWILMAFALTAWPAVSAAQMAPDGVGYRGWGPRVGLTIDPDQVHFGVHSDFGYVARRVRFQPNVEIGVLDGATVAAFNFEASYRFRETWDVWTPYVGGGPSLSMVNRDGDDSDADVGLNALGGVERGLSNGDRFFAEVKLGLFDAPAFKMTAGWTFYP